MRGSGQRLPITLRFTRVLGTFSHTTCFPFSCALWAFFSDRSVSGECSEPIGALMPHAALFVVQPCMVGGTPSLRLVSMPHAALWVVQRTIGGFPHEKKVSMPHATLWVWCSRSEKIWQRLLRFCFNAARGFVGGAASSLAVLVPLGEKALLESLRKFERSDGKYVKYPFLFSFSPAQALARSAPSTPMSKLESLDGVMRLCGTSPRLSISFSAPSIS